jgi:uncharacterized protein YndB with AHSA1/START domain
MKVDLQSEQEVSEANAKAVTSHTLQQWFALLDAQGGLALGRRALGVWMRDEMKVDAWWCPTINHEYELARGQVEKDGKPKGYMICATKSIKADPARCFAAFASGAALDAWFGKGNQIDLKDGGSWTCADGNQATVKKVNPGKTIKLVWEDKALSMPAPLEIKFDTAGGPGKCTVMVSVDRLQTRAEADGYRKAWGKVLDQLKAVIEA